MLYGFSPAEICVLLFGLCIFQSPGLVSNLELLLVLCPNMYRYVSTPPNFIFTQKRFLHIIKQSLLPSHTFLRAMVLTICGWTAGVVADIRVTASLSPSAARLCPAMWLKSHLCYSRANSISCQWKPWSSATEGAPIAVLLLNFWDYLSF